MKYTIEQLYDEFFEPVYRFVSLRVNSRETAEDLTSECFLKIAEHFGRFDARQEGSVRAWVFTIARRTVIDHYRRRKDASLPEEFDLADPRIRICEDVDVALAHKTAMEALNELPDRQREILLLRFQSELRNKEIAKLLDMNETTVAANVSRGLGSLRAKLPSTISV